MSGVATLDGTHVSDQAGYPGSRKPIKFAAINTATSADLVDAVTGKKVRVLSLFLALASTTTVKFQSGAATDLTGAMTLAAGHLQLVLPFNVGGWFQTAAGAKLNLVLGAGVQTSGHLTYIEAD